MFLSLQKKLHKIAILWVFISLIITFIDWQGRLYGQHPQAIYFLKLWLFWLHWTACPLLLSALINGVYYFKNSINNINNINNIKSFVKGLLIILRLVVLSAWAWAGIIEPSLLSIRHTTISVNKLTSLTPNNQIPKPLNIALISDIHWGMYTRDWHINRLVNQLNALKNIDAVLIAGDLTYEPNQNLKHGFSPFKRLSVPVFAVLGNHDLQRPGPFIKEALYSALNDANIQLIEGKSINFKGWQLIGLDDLVGGNPTPQIREMIQHFNHLASPYQIILTHEPDTFGLLPTLPINNPRTAQIGLAGHTHGGQVWLPWITPTLLKKMAYPWYNGLYSTSVGQIFVTTGVGMSVLPFRFGVTPTIDILQIKVN